ncbi:hypothetical protein [Rhizobium sp. Rhizsp82]|uniref:hypothetical protein n=1 Tax=Rhizobium sp. Rhizsp82 TaxID=3243057 RepID=UPI0039B5062F
MMKKLVTVVLLSVGIVSGSLMQASATSVPDRSQVSSPWILKVQDSRDRGLGKLRGPAWRDYNERFEPRKKIRRGYYNGYRGYPERRRGFREYKGYWYPREAFILRF